MLQAPSSNRLSLISFARLFTEPRKGADPGLILLVFLIVVETLTFLEGPAMAEAEEQKKNKKINRMTLQEINDAIKKTQEHMKGDTSQYAQALNARKAELEAK
ncbi:MAG TPA: hypothetical protein DEA96_13020 [Leptospiraceae bacterium]|nr:hypothetical protein [Spirochaetaceae bacterium]HBS05884.1 hypothetical protein [Leptospiraceae bacterium]